MLNSNNARNGNIKYSISKSSGFTLIEILVAIAIVGLVFGIIISSAAGIQRAGRNAQRKADLRTIQTALQQYYADQQKFPPSPLGSDVKSPDGTKIYLKKVPTDPQGAAYTYTPQKNHSDTASCDNVTTTCSYYKVCIAAELPASDLNSECSGSSFGVTPL